MTNTHSNHDRRATQRPHVFLTSTTTGKARPNREATRQRHRILALIAAVVLVFAGCSNPNDEPSQPTSASTVTPPTQPSESGSPSPDPTTTALNKLTAGKTVELTTDTLPEPPPGFSTAEVEAFGERAIDLVRRGTSPELTAMTSAEAFDFVFAKQYPESTNATRQAFEAVGDYDYAWTVASRFVRAPTEPAKIIAARWQVTTSPGKTAAGTTAPRLLVALSVAIEHDIPISSNREATGGTAPIVIQRTILVQGFKPLGGQSWWPAIGVQANPYLGGKCALTNGGLLTPATRPTTIRNDLDDLRRYLNKPETIVGATSTGDDLAGYLKKYCED